MNKKHLRTTYRRQLDLFQSKQPTVLLTPLHTEPLNLIIYNLILDCLFCVVCWRCLVWNTQAKYKIDLWERKFKLCFKFPACLLSQQGRWKRPKTESSLTSREIPGTTTTKDTADYSNIHGWVAVNSVSRLRDSLWGQTGPAEWLQTDPPSVHPEQRARRKGRDGQRTRFIW